MRIGELFAGYGGLGMGVQEAIGGELAWLSDHAPGPSKILAHRFPDVPNLGDLTRIDWAAVEPVDVLTGGSPCQDLSTAGKRAGMTDGTRSNLWAVMREAIAQLRPALVVWENVRGAYSAPAASALEHCPGCMGDARHTGPSLRALGRVLGDLSDLGYDARWHGLRAADVGAPHGRFRVFVAAYPHHDGPLRIRRKHPAQPDPHRRNRPHRPRPATQPTPFHVLPTPISRDVKGPSRPDRRPPRADNGRLRTIGDQQLPDAVLGGEWGRYAEAVHRWESLTRPAPAATELGPTGTARLAAPFSEWMMGLPAGWVTEVPGLTRAEALTALGNGVVPQQATAALSVMLDEAAA